LLLFETILGSMQDIKMPCVQISRHIGEANICAATEGMWNTVETMVEIMS
jgi:hypothetical protein